jgi:hypothetical protein
MRDLKRVLDAMAVLVPDFQTWGLSASVFFSIYCCAQTLGFSGKRGADSGLLLSLVLGYIVDLGHNLASFLSHTPAPRVADLPGPKPPTKEASREAPAQHPATTASLRYWP